MFKCTSCNEIVYNRKIDYCVSCKEPLPEYMKMTEKQKQKLEEQTKTLRKSRDTNNSINNSCGFYDSNIVSDCGGLDCGGDSGGC